MSEYFAEDVASLHDEDSYGGSKPCSHAPINTLEDDHMQ